MTEGVDFRNRRKLASIQKAKGSRFAGPLWLGFFHRVNLQCGIATFPFFVDTETSNHLKCGSVCGLFQKRPAAAVCATSRACLKGLPDDIVFSLGVYERGSASVNLDPSFSHFFVQPGDDCALQHWVESISLKRFGKPFIHTARFNSRLRTTGGRYFLDDHRIEISSRHLEQLGREVVEGIICHELCHYHLHLEGRGYRHRDADFKALLKQVGGLRYTPPLPGTEGRKTRPDRYILQCMDCGLKARRKKRMDPKRYCCGICGGKLTLYEE